MNALTNMNPVKLYPTPQNIPRDPNAVIIFKLGDNKYYADFSEIKAQREFMEQKQQELDKHTITPFKQVFNNVADTDTKKQTILKSALFAEKYGIKVNNPEIQQKLNDLKDITDKRPTIDTSGTTPIYLAGVDLYKEIEEKAEQANRIIACYHSKPTDDKSINKVAISNLFNNKEITDSIEASLLPNNLNSLYDKDLMDELLAYTPESDVITGLNAYKDIMLKELNSKSVSISFNFKPEDPTITIRNNNVDVTIRNTDVISKFKKLLKHYLK